MVFAHEDTLNMAQPSDAIAKMRDGVRANYVDIRMKSRVMKIMIDLSNLCECLKFQETRVDQLARLGVRPV